MPGARLVQLDQIPGVPCPCGTARRAFANLPGAVASVHLVDIRADAARHHHQVQTEVYVVLEGEGEIEVDGVLHPVRPLTAIYLPPGVRHRAHGNLRILNLVVPPYDPADEHPDPGD